MQPFVDEHRRLRAGWRLLAQYLSYRVVAVLLANLAVAAWLLARFGTLSPDGPAVATLSDSPALFLISNLASLAAALLTVWLAGRFLDRRPFKDFGFHLNGGWLLDLLFGMALGAVLMAAIFLTQFTLGWVEITDSFTVSGDSGGAIGTPFALAALLPIALFVCVGVAEETMFRGYELRNAAEGLGGFFGARGAILAAWAGTSIFFGVLHAFNPNAGVMSTINISLAGILLGMGYVLTGELSVPIGLHITWNLFQSAVFGFPVSGLGPIGATAISVEQGGPTLWTGGSFGPEAGLLGTAAIAAGCLLTVLWVRLRTGAAEIHAPLAQGPVSKSLEERDAAGA